MNHDKALGIEHLRGKEINKKLELVSVRVLTNSYLGSPNLTRA